MSFRSDQSTVQMPATIKDIQWNARTAGMFVAIWGPILLLIYETLKLIQRLVITIGTILVNTDVMGKGLEVIIVGGGIAGLAAVSFAV